MRLRKPNNNKPIINAQGDDKVVVDGYLTPAEIVERGKLAATNTIETLKAMYPHSPEQKVREMEIIANKELNDQLRRLEQDNKENISAYYEKHRLRDKIKSIQNEINKMQEQYENTKQINQLYKKEQKIKELEDIIESMKKQ